MLKSIIKTSIGLISLALFSFSSATFASYGQKICNNSGFYCHKVQRGETWSSLFPDSHERDVVKRINRMNTPLSRGMVIAVPENLDGASAMQFSPFPHHSYASSTNYIKVNLNTLAWGAYNKSGELVKWGPASGGKSYCPDINRSCRTVSGTFTVYDEQGEGCKSSIYPRPNGGAPMPYCMHFYKGYALHGSSTVPGRNDSHGCVRLYKEDARWLKEEFVRPGYTKVTVTR